MLSEAQIPSTPARAVALPSPPQSIEAEETVLGAILLNPGAIERIAEFLKPEHFYVSAHGEIYKAALDLFNQGTPVGLIQVFDQLRAVGEIDRVGGQSRLASLIGSTVSSTNIDLYAQLIVKKWKRREVFRIAQQLCRDAYDERVEFEEIIDQAEKVMMGLADNDSSTLVALQDDVQDAFEEIEQRFEDGIQPGFSTGFYDLDAMTQGLKRQDLIIVAGRPSMGKSSIAMNIAKNVAIAHKLPVVVFSLETSARQISHRFLSQQARIESGRLRSAKIAQNEWDSLAGAVASLSEVPIYVDDSSAQSVSNMRSQCRRVKARHGLGMVILDYLQIMVDEENESHAIGKVTRGMKKMARDLDVPVMVLSQLNRAVEARTNKRPQMADLKSSGAIEQDADLILMVYRDEYYNPDTPDRGIAEVALTKNRDGDTGVVKLLFEKQFTQFRNLAKPSA